MKYAENRKLEWPITEVVMTELEYRISKDWQHYIKYQTDTRGSVPHLASKLAFYVTKKWSREQAWNDFLTIITRHAEEIQWEGGRQGF
jgi:hypothetical protein